MVSNLLNIDETGVARCGFDDVFGSDIMGGRGARKLSQICIKHRHLGPLREGGAIGASLIFNVQAYKLSRKCLITLVLMRDMNHNDNQD